MATREEIREGMALKLAIRDGYDESASKYYLLEANEWMQYLHSLGVVIKVDRELPKFAKNWDEDGHIFHDAIVPVTKEDLAEAGYEAVEPLIKE